MNSLDCYIQILIDGALKLAPAIIAAGVAYRLWRLKEDQERTNEAIRACWNFALFCKLLSSELQSEPSQVSHIDANSLSKYLDIYFDLPDINPRVDDAYQIYAKWKHRAYFGSTGDEPEVKTSIAALNSLSEIGHNLANHLSVLGQKHALSRKQLRRVTLARN